MITGWIPGAILFPGTHTESLQTCHGQILVTYTVIREPAKLENLVEAVYSTGEAEMRKEKEEKEG